MSLGGLAPNSQTLPGLKNSTYTGGTIHCGKKGCERPGVGRDLEMGSLPPIDMRTIGKKAIFRED